VKIVYVIYLINNDELFGSSLSFACIA